MKSFKVLLVYETPKNKSLYLNQLQPLGILYIASFLESKGIKTYVKDYYVEKRKPINYAKYDYIGFSMNSANVENTLSSIRKIKKQYRKARIIIGGAHAGIVAKKLITNKSVECLVVDEAEDILYKYIIAKDKRKVKGIWIRDKGKSLFTGKRKPVDNLDSLPFPAFDKIPYKKYKMMIKKKTPVCAINTSRGCPHGCIFCYHALGYKYRARSPDNVFKEMKWLHKDMGINEFWIADDDFTEDMIRVEKICDLIIKNKLNVSISVANGVVTSRLNEKLLKKMKKAGFWFLSISPEVGTESSLKKLRKDFTLKDVEKIVKICKKLGIRTMANFMMGFPWEGKQDLINTIKFMLKLDTDMLCLNRLVPYPGTPLWNMTKKGDFSLIDEKRSTNDKRFKHPVLNESEIKGFLKLAHRKFYSPRRVIKIIRAFGIKAALKMMLYAFASKSMY